MHVRAKFDGGKVVNRSQSGSWEHHCMGAGLQHNMGKEWVGSHNMERNDEHYPK